MLDSDPDIRQLGEVFSSRHSMGVHKTLMECAAGPDFSFRHKDMNYVFDKHLQSLHSKYDEDVLVIDAKYNSMGPFNGYGWSITREPQFIAYCDEHEIPIIHLIRKDMVGVLASESLAVRTKVWHLEKGEERAENGSIKVPLRAFKRDYHRLLIEATRFCDAIGRCSRAVTIFFEDLLVDDTFQDGPLKQIEDLLGRPLKAERQALLNKVSPPPSEFITNFEDLEAFMEKDKALERIRKGLWAKVEALSAAKEPAS
jgi:hypothetical protein